MWVFGTLQTTEQAAELLAEIDRGETTSAINAFIVQEALAAFDRTQSLSAADRDAVKVKQIATTFDPEWVPEAQAARSTELVEST